MGRMPDATDVVRRRTRALVSALTVAILAAAPFLTHRACAQEASAAWVSSATLLHPLRVALTTRQTGMDWTAAEVDRIESVVAPRLRDAIVRAARAPQTRLVTGGGYVTGSGAGLGVLSQPIAQFVFSLRVDEDALLIVRELETGSLGYSEQAGPGPIFALLVSRGRVLPTDFRGIGYYVTYAASISPSGCVRTLDPRTVNYKLFGIVDAEGLFTGAAEVRFPVSAVLDRSPHVPPSSCRR